MRILLYPVAVILFWYKDGVIAILSYFESLNDYVVRLFSLPGLFGTYFTPLKNEYRKNLVLFSVLFGVVIKTFLIIASLSILAVVFLLECILFVLYVSFPVLPFLILLR